MDWGKVADVLTEQAKQPENTSNKELLCCLAQALHVGWEKSQINQDVFTELMTATGVLPILDEPPQEFLSRLAKRGDKLSSNQFKNLSNASQDWLNGAIISIKAKITIPLPQGYLIKTATKVVEAPPPTNEVEPITQQGGPT